MPASVCKLCNCKISGLVFVWPVPTLAESVKPNNALAASLLRLGSSFLCMAVMVFGMDVTVHVTVPAYRLQ
jgi:hypothetical protein